jgi:hypothetical protein
MTEGMALHFTRLPFSDEKYFDEIDTSFGPFDDRTDERG